MPESVNKIPHLSIVIGTTIAAIAGYAAFSVWVFFQNKDASLMGDVAGTWKSFAVLAFGFWLGSSSAGKTQGPTDVKVTNDPLPVMETKKDG